MIDNEIIKAFELCFQPTGKACRECTYHEYEKLCKVERNKDALDLINRQKAKIEALQMDNQQLQSDIINANQNYDHIKGLWEVEKEKVEKAKQKVINVCKELQTAKAEIERLKGWQDLLKAEKHSLIKSEAIESFRQKVNQKMGKHTAYLGKEYVQRIMREVEKEMVGKENV